MTRKEKKEKELEQKSTRKKKIIIIVISIVVIIALVIGAFFVVNYAKISKYTAVVPKDTIRNEIVGSTVTIENPRVLSNSSRFADNFAVEDIMKDGQKIGEEAIIVIDNPDASKSPKIPQSTSMLMIVDNNLKILGVKPFDPSYFDLGIDASTFFDAFKEKEPLPIINKYDGIYTGDSNTAILIKNKVREVMGLFYIEKYGEAKYDSLSNNSYEFAEKGTKVTPITAKDIDGNEINLADFKNYKLFIVGGNPGCGGCVESIQTIARDIASYDLTDTKFIVFAFTSDSSDAKKIIDLLPKGTIGILDPGRSISAELKVDVSPTISLVDKNLTLFYRGPGEPTNEMLAQLKDFFGSN
jgi:hypothetical protein